MRSTGNKGVTIGWDNLTYDGGGGCRYRRLNSIFVVMLCQGWRFALSSAGFKFAGRRITEDLPKPERQGCQITMALVDCQ